MSRHIEVILRDSHMREVQTMYYLEIIGISGETLYEATGELPTWECPLGSEDEKKILEIPLPDYLEDHVTGVKFLKSTLRIHSTGYDKYEYNIPQRLWLEIFWGNRQKLVALSPEELFPQNGIEKALANGTDIMNEFWKGSESLVDRVKGFFRN